MFYQWKGTCLGYIFLLIAICWVPVIIQWHYSWGSALNIFQPIVAQVPTIHIEKGVLSTDVEQPYKIVEPQSQMVIAVIDTTGATTIDQVPVGVLVTKNQIIMRKGPTETQTIELDKLGDCTIDQASINGWINVLKYAMLASYPVVLIFAYVYRIIQLLIYALIGLIFAGICGTDRSYLGLMRISAVAVTPSILLDTACGAAGIHFSFLVGALFWILLFAVSMGYLFFGVKSAATAPTAATPPPL